MKIEEAYLRYVNLVNRNATNNNLSVDKPRFVMNFNDMSVRYVQWMLEKRNDDSLRNLSKVLVVDQPLQAGPSDSSKSQFELPDNYLDFSNLNVVASKGSCSNKKLFTFEIKSEDEQEILSDEFNKPSFEYRETPYFFSGDSVVILKDNFSIDKALLTYYRYPAKVDISGYLNFENQQSTSIDPEFDDKVVLKILYAMAKEFSANNGDAGKYQIEKDRLFSDI